jgi:hypothetical protein
MVLLAPATLIAFVVGFAAIDRLVCFTSLDHSIKMICYPVLALASTYLWNLVLIGVPAMHLCAIGCRRLLLHIGLVSLVGLVVVALTAMAEDRISSLAGWLHDALWLGPFVSSGMAVGWLVWFLVRRRWSGTNGAALVMAFLTAILANPMLALYPLFLFTATMIPCL